MGDSYITSIYWLVGLMFPFNFLGVSDPQLEFLGVSGHPRPGLPWIWISMDKSMDISMDISMCGYET